MKRILWLSNSEDLSEAVPESSRSWSLAAGILQAEVEEEVSVVPRAIWPSPELPQIVDRWLRRYEPDIVVFKVNAYWYLYRSVPLRIRRRFGRIGSSIASGGEHIGSTPWITRQRAYHWFRAGMLKAVGGDTHFPPDYVSALTEECAMRVLRDENRRLVINTTLDHWTSNPEPQAAVHRRLKRFCGSVHAGYIGADIEHDPPPPNLYARGDRLHTDAAGHEWQSRILAQSLIAEVRRGA
ncbi:MAG: hypothetical protein AB7J35_07510 [Dehalococcoidia bacterium]